MHMELYPNANTYMQILVRLSGETTQVSFNIWINMQMRYFLYVLLFIHSRTEIRLLDEARSKIIVSCC